MIDSVYPAIPQMMPWDFSKRTFRTPPLYFRGAWKTLEAVNRPIVDTFERRVLSNEPHHHSNF